MSNPAIPRNYLVIALRPSAALGLLSALGALGGRFGSPSLDWLFNKGQNPPWEKIGKNK